MAEVRSVSSTGGEKGVKEERYDLLPKPGLDAIARVFAFGAEKYASHNWRRGYEWGKSYAALQRHITAFWEGETCDPESGLPHLGHAGFHVLALLTWLEEQGEGGEFDDRYVPTHRAPIEDVDETDDSWGFRQFGPDLIGKRRAEPLVIHHVNTDVEDTPLAHFTVRTDGEITENVMRRDIEAALAWHLRQDRTR